MTQQNANQQNANQQNAADVDCEWRFAGDTEWCSGPCVVPEQPAPALAQPEHLAEQAAAHAQQVEQQHQPAAIDWTEKIDRVRIEVWTQTNNIDIVAYLAPRAKVERCLIKHNGSVPLAFAEVMGYEITDNMRDTSGER